MVKSQNGPETSKPPKMPLSKSKWNYEMWFDSIENQTSFKLKNFQRTQFVSNKSIENGRRGQVSKWFQNTQNLSKCRFKNQSKMNKYDLIL